MLRILLSLLLAGCAPFPRTTTMPIRSLVLGAGLQGSGKSGPLADSPAAALGRRILSTAFVRVGPDGNLTVELHGGRTLVLRDVVMGPSKYCGLRIAGRLARTRYCGGYADVAAARPGGGPEPKPIEAAPAPLRKNGSTIG